MASGEECDGGLRLRTALFCNFDETFPRKTVCSFSGNMTVFQACGDVEIYMTPSKEGFRFYISYIGIATDIATCNCTCLYEKII